MKIAMIAGVLAALGAASSAEAMPVAPVTDPSSLTIQVSGGCGPNGWRGPGGACHFYHFGVYYGGPVYLGGPVYYSAPTWNGCPPGYWRGPWGHCRNTPYHGRLPGGGWQP